MVKIISQYSLYNLGRWAKPKDNSSKFIMMTPPSKCDKIPPGLEGPTDIKQIGTLAKGRQLKYKEFCHISRGGDSPSGP